MYACMCMYARLHYCCCLGFHFQSRKHYSNRSDSFLRQCSTSLFWSLCFLSSSLLMFPPVPSFFPCSHFFYSTYWSISSLFSISSSSPPSLFSAFSSLRLFFPLLLPTDNHIQTIFGRRPPDGSRFCTHDPGWHPDPFCHCTCIPCNSHTCRPWSIGETSSRR